MTEKSGTLTRKYITRIILLFVLLLGIAFLSLCLGYTDLSVADVLRVLSGNGTGEENLIVFDFRMLRLVLAVLIGMGLSVSGNIFQTISKNALASPDLLGVSAGAGMAVLLCSYFDSGERALGIFVLPIAAIIGALLVATLIYGIAHEKDRPISPVRLVLIGISVSAGLNAMDMIITVKLSPEQFNTVNTWLIGNVYGNTWKHAWLLLVWILLILPYLVYHASDLNVLRMSDGVAIGLGSPVKKHRLRYLLLATVLAAVCVAIGGAIGFVGLVCPHLAKRLVGPNHRYSIPASALVGAVLLTLSDMLARTVIAPSEMLLGIIVSLIGAPYFLYILLRAKV